MGAGLATSFGWWEKQGGAARQLRLARVCRLWHRMALGVHGRGAADELGDALEPGVHSSGGGAEME